MVGKNIKDKEIEMIAKILLTILICLFTSPLMAAMLTWDANPLTCNDPPVDCAPDGYIIYFWEDGTVAPVDVADAMARDTEIFRKSVDGTTTQQPLDATMNLSPGVTYHFGLTAFNSAGESAIGFFTGTYTVPVYSTGDNLPNIIIIVPQGQPINLQIVTQ